MNELKIKLIESKIKAFEQEIKDLKIELENEITNSNKEINFKYKGVWFSFVKVPAGEFTLGDNSHSDSPEKKIYLDEYYIGKYPVTVEQWNVFNKQLKHAKSNKAPITDIEYKSIELYIDKLNRKLNNKYDINLPTEAQWEKAATYGDSFKDVDYSLYGCIGEKIESVGTKLPNELGIYDLVGGVFEFVQDIYLRNGYSNLNYKNPKPVTYGNCKNRVIRSGSTYSSKVVRDVRYRSLSEVRSDIIGFRLMLNIKKNNDT